MTAIEPQPAASAKHMALIKSDQGEIVANIKDFRSRVIHLEPTLSYAIAWAGYCESQSILHTSMQDALQRLKAREQAILFAAEPSIREISQLRDDVERFEELLEAMGEAVNDLKKNKLQFEMDIHMSVVEMVRVRW